MNQGKQVFEFEQAGSTLILTAHGPFMEFRDNDIRNAYNEAYRLLSLPETKHLLVDFSKLDYFGSTFVGILIRLAKKARSGGGDHRARRQPRARCCAPGPCGGSPP